MTFKVIDPGHEYEITGLDGAEPQRVKFVKREGPNYPGNIGTHPGMLTQDLLRVALDRCIYMNAQGSCAETDIIIASLRTAIMAFEVRAARCRGVNINLKTLAEIDRAETCPKCGHIQCDQERHNQPHWSEKKP